MSLRTIGNIIKIIPALCVIAGIIPSSLCRAEDVIKIGGMGSGLGVMRILGDAFEKKNPETDVRVVPSLGSSVGIKATAKGALDIGVSARPLNEEEKKYALAAKEYAITPFVIITREDTPVYGLNTEDLIKIYGGRLRTWPDRKRIRLVLRPEEEIDTRIVRKMSPEMGKAMTAAMSRKGMLTAITDQDTTSIVEKTPGALGFSTLGQVITEKLHLKILHLNGVSPTALNLSKGSYKAGKTLFLVTKAQVSVSVRRFLDFV